MQSSGLKVPNKVPMQSFEAEVVDRTQKILISLSGAKVDHRHATSRS